MAFEELLLLNSPKKTRRTKKMARRKSRRSSRRIRRNEPIFMNKRRSRRYSRGIGGMKSSLTFGDFAFAGIGGIATTVVPKMIPMTRYGWANVIGSGVIAIGGSMLLRATKVVDQRNANAFAFGGATITTIKLLNQLGILGRLGISDVGAEEWEDVSGVGAIATGQRVSDVGAYDEDEIVL